MNYHLEIKFVKLKMSRKYIKMVLLFPRMKRIHQALSSQGILPKHLHHKGVINTLENG